MMRELWHAFEARLSELLAWVESFAHTPYGAQALFALAFLESSVFPIPPDALLIPLCLAHPEQAFWFATLCSLGSVLGGMAGYGLGRYGGRPILTRLFRREWIAAVEEKYDRYNAWATGIGGFTPLPYKLFTVSGGVFRIHFGIFVLASTLSRSARFFLVATVLYWFGPPARSFIEQHLGLLTVLFVILLIAGFWFISRSWRRSGPTAQGADELETGIPTRANMVARQEGETMEEGHIIARRYLLSGRVQGVGFRYFTRRQAAMLKIAGWVRNLPDGRVEVLAAGFAEPLTLFERQLAEGPPAAEVTAVDTQDAEPPPDNEFTVRN